MEPENTPTGKDYASGIFITNEGMFSSGSGTLGWYDPDKKQYHEGVFSAANGFELGSVVQSVARYNGRAYIVVNNSGRVEVMDICRRQLPECHVFPLPQSAYARAFHQSTNSNKSSLLLPSFSDSRSKNIPPTPRVSSLCFMKK